MVQFLLVNLFCRLVFRVINANNNNNNKIYTRMERMKENNNNNGGRVNAKRVC